MSQDCIELKIPNSREKLKVLFPEDPRGDFKLVFKSKVFKLQKAYLRLQSGYFKRNCFPDILEIKETFNIQQQHLEQELFSSILSCFYGNKISVPRTQVLLYYPIIKFLEVDSLMTQLRKDMVQHIQNYDLFTLMRIAHKYNEQQIFQSCFFQLQKQGFEQMNYNNSELLNCSVELFKLIIKTHNRKKSLGNKSLDYKAIDNFIKQYCQTNSLDEEKYHEYKFQLIDKTKLTAKQYKEIFMDQLAKPRQIRQSFMKTADIGGFSSNESSTLVSSKPMFQSMIGPSFRNNSIDLTLEMENTFHKKLNEELKQQKQQLIQYVNKLTQSTQSNKLINSQLQRQLQDLREKLKGKDKEENQQKSIIKIFQDMMKNMEKSLTLKDSAIKKLQEKVQNLCKIVSSKEFQGVQQDSLIIESQIIPSNLIGDLMKKKPIVTEKSKTLQITNKSYCQSLDQYQIQQSYQDRICFDINPISIPKTYIPILVNFLGTDGFNQKKLNLIFRRSHKYPSVGTPRSIRNRKGIVVLIKTQTDLYIGGYISVEITEEATDYIQDSNAFIFSLSKGKKFNVTPTSRSEAVYLSQHFLIGFGNDLSISKDVLNEESYCNWSSSFEKGNQQEQGSTWFAGGHEFMIKDLEMYQVADEEMVMNID